MLCLIKSARCGNFKLAALAWVLWTNSLSNIWCTAAGCRRNNSQKIMTESECILTSMWLILLTVVSLNGLVCSLFPFCAFCERGQYLVDCLCPYSYKYCFLKQQKHLASLLLWYLTTFLIKTSVEASCLVLVFLAMLVCMLWVVMSEWGSWVMSNVIWRKRAKNEGKGSVK